MPRFPTSSPLPPRYYYFFAVVEPLLTVAGAVYALAFPAAYFDDVLPFRSVHLVLLLIPFFRG